MSCEKRFHLAKEKMERAHNASIARDWEHELGIRWTEMKTPHSVSRKDADHLPFQFRRPGLNKPKTILGCGSGSCDTIRKFVKHTNHAGKKAGGCQWRTPKYSIHRENKKQKTNYPYFKNWRL